MISARRYYRFSLGLGALGVLTLALALALAVIPYSVAPALPTMSDLAAACRPFLIGTSLPAILVTLLAALGVASAVRALRTAIRHSRAQRRLMRRLQILDLLQAAGVTAEIFLDGRPQAFCAGLVRPRIFLSTGAVRVLDRDEIGAVLAHEAHHAAQRDPLRILIAAVLRDALFFLPIMRHVAERYGAMAEMAADEAAVRRCGDRAPLASAMLTFGQRAPGGERAPSGAVGIAPERVDHLLGEAPQWQLSLSLLAAGAATLVAVAVLGAATATVAPTTSLAMLAMQLCALAMTVVPVLGGAALILTVRRGVARGRRRG